MWIAISYDATCYVVKQQNILKLMILQAGGWD